MGGMPAHGDKVELPADYSSDAYIRQMVEEHFDKSSLSFAALPITLAGLLDQVLPPMIGSREALVANGVTDLGREGAFFCSAVALTVENFVLRCRLAIANGVPEDQVLEHVMYSRDTV